MAVTTSSSSRGTLVKKLRLSNVSSSPLMPVRTTEPGIASVISISISRSRERTSSLSHLFSASLSTDTNQLELTSVPG